MSILAAPASSVAAAARTVLRSTAMRLPGLPRTRDLEPLHASDPVRVDGYRLMARLGRGGMANVYYALGPSAEPVAVKILRTPSGGREACLREYRLASAVDVDCTAAVLGCGVSKVGAYLVTAYLPGYRCGTTLEGRHMSAGQLWTFGAALARVLAAVHAREVVHCDLKPSNLLVNGDDVRLIDFGIARYFGERCRGEGLVECTRGWAAPEQMRAAPATPAMDVFAWGRIVAYLASGVHPSAGIEGQESVAREPAAVPNLSGVPAGMVEVLGWAMADEPRDRPAAHELVSTCRRCGDRRPRPAPRRRRGAVADPHNPWWPWR